MAYIKTSWQDWPLTTTPINSARLNNMESQIEQNDIKLPYQSGTVYSPVIFNTLGVGNYIINGSYQYYSAGSTYTAIGNLILIINAEASDSSTKYGYLFNPYTDKVTRLQMTSSGCTVTEYLLSDFLQKSNVANNLTTTTEGSVLDARQGKIINDTIADVPHWYTYAEVADI